MVDQLYNQIRRMERKFYPPIHRALNKQVLLFIERFKKYGTYADTQLSSVELEGALKRLYYYAAITQAKRINRLTDRVKAANMGSNPVWIKDVTDYLQKYLSTKSVGPITETTRGLIIRVLQEGIQGGYTHEYMVEQLMQLLNLNQARALRIVRTELTSASNFGYMMGAYDSKYEMNKVWVSVGDNRVRPTHRHTTGVDGEVRGFFELFSNGLLYPGDPQGSPTELINCRCRIVFRVKKDENGNAILKKNPPVSQYVAGVGLTRNSLIKILWQSLVVNLVSRAVNTLMENQMSE